MSKVSRVSDGLVLDGREPLALPRPSAEILLFPTPARRNTLRPLDRIDTMQWASVARECGLSRIEICDDGADPEIGHFVLVYEDGRDWASWGVSREGRGFSLWRPGVAGEIGQFATMRDALDMVLLQPRRNRRKLPIR